MKSENEIEVVAQVREIVERICHLHTSVAGIGVHSDLFDAGMSSHTAVHVMVEVEERFGIEFPDEQLTKSTFRSIDSIAGAVAAMQH